MNLQQQQREEENTEGGYRENSGKGSRIAPNCYCTVTYPKNGVWHTVNIFCDSINRIEKWHAGEARWLLLVTVERDEHIKLEFDTREAWTKAFDEITQVKEAWENWKYRDRE